MAAGLVTGRHQLKMLATDGKLRLTDVVDAETLLRLVQSVPSPKAEPIKLWLAKVGYERMTGQKFDPLRRCAIKFVATPPAALSQGSRAA
jgi:DNA-damage-inducible protein D